MDKYIRTELGSRGLMNKPFKKRSEEIVQLARSHLLTLYAVEVNPANVELRFL